MWSRGGVVTRGVVKRGRGQSRECVVKGRITLQITVQQEVESIAGFGCVCVGQAKRLSNDVAVVVNAQPNVPSLGAVEIRNGIFAHDSVVFEPIWVQNSSS